MGDAIEMLEYKNQNTNTSGGLLLAARDVFVVSAGDRANSPNVAIVITDGKSTWDSEITVQSSDTLKNKGVRALD